MSPTLRDWGSQRYEGYKESCVGGGGGGWHANSDRLRKLEVRG